MELEQAKWLIETGAALLAGAGKSVSKGANEFAHPSAHRLAGCGWLSAWQTSLLREQCELRSRAASRFPASTRWLWTDRSLAQASDWWCARFKASLFPAGDLVVDGCCGAGVDLVALAARGEVLGIDSDRALVALANANLLAHELPPSAIVGDLPPDMPATARWLHIDPDRRAIDSISRRLRHAEDYSPTLSESLKLAKSTQGAVIKLAPTSIVEPEVELAVGADIGLIRVWLGNLSECRQQLLVTGKLTQNIASIFSASDAVETERVPGWRGAVLCEPNLQAVTFSGFPQEICEGELSPRRYIYDLHAVLHAAQLQLAWAEPLGAYPLGTSQGYFTSDVSTISRWAQCFEVVDCLPWDLRRVRRWLREHRIGEVEVKKRLLSLDANAQQRALRGAGSEKITLMVTRLGDRTRAVLAKRV